MQMNNITDSNLNSQTWKELVKTQIIPKWMNSLHNKKEKEVEFNANADARTDTIWKKIVRD